MPSDNSSSFSVVPESVREFLTILMDIYHQEFEFFFERAWQVTGTLPLQPNNDVRNAINHFYLAFFESDTLAKVEANFQNAIAHITLGTCDCLLISNAHFRNVLSFYIRRIRDQYDLSAYETMLEKYESIRQLHEEVPDIAPIPLEHKDPRRADNDKLSKNVDALAEILSQYAELYKKLKKEYPLRNAIDTDIQFDESAESLPAAVTKSRWDTGDLARAALVTLLAILVLGSAFSYAVGSVQAALERGWPFFVALLLAAVPVIFFAGIRRS